MTGDADTPRIDGLPACESCGYCLQGISGSEAHAVCPECGERCDRDVPWTAAPWPTKTKCLLALCGPALTVLAALLVATVFRSTRNLLVWPFWSLWLPGILICTMIVPIGIAKQLATKSEPRVARRAAIRRVVVPALTINAVATIAAAIAFFALL